MLPKLLKIAVPVLALGLLFGCSHQKYPVKIDAAEILHQNEDQLTQVIIYDVFTPPVASRIYGYTSLAAYEAIRFTDPKYKSLITQLKGFGKPPVPEKGKKYDFTLAATHAFFTVAHKVTFSVDSLKKYEARVYEKFRNNLDDSTFERSAAFGDSIGKLILKRAAVDNYPQTRGKPRFLGSTDAGKWRPTPPDYLDGVEYCWGTMKTFAVDSSSQFRLPPPPKYSEDKNSEFFKQVQQVYDKCTHLSKDEELIARYWDDNPFVIQHTGHIMYANKKITPGGHWIGITAIACKKTHADAVKTAQAYALTAIALYDAFICSWEDKYFDPYIRPVTVINDKIDHNWLPLLQTPPFPEYPSGHSDISAASSTILTHLFGDNFAFQDTSDLRYISMQRHFDSFIKASDETSISRFYGGIHYLNSVNQGAVQGHEVGEYIWNKLKLTN
ncbi:vanadium-dependent haloperoxidase [Mucilaginibacter sp. KACC 22063]|uniref:vanadium-dependent haloperoxidase n=1 Tax=Mucilaginibacter sp. KACC 22063 TaxID=3025666 RepID=UPI002366B306|nr:vanadium-dependent haloperoxidase [Mucilaginibacter sp. KACC 22063]WDF56633.1 vanadium-dependent haloperoxidase [Mucilaginibacter sp. KACC 22063]